MGKNNVPKAVGHVHDDKKARQERAIAEHKAAKKLAAVHHNLHIREDSGGLSDREQILLDLKTKREDKALRAKDFLDRARVDPDSGGAGTGEGGGTLGKCIFYHQPGGCRHGDQCRFLHDGPGGGGDRGGGGSSGGTGTSEASEHHPLPASEVPCRATPRPANEALACTIEKLAARVAKVGSQLEAMVLEKQGDNPAFAFLHAGGEGADYYEAQKQSAMRAPPP